MCISERNALPRRKSLLQQNPFGRSGFNLRESTKYFLSGGPVAISFITILVMLLAISWRTPRIGDRWLRPLEQHAARFARSKSLTIVSLGLVTMLSRLALLPLLPVPVPAVHDEFSHLLAADTFTHARLTNPPHPMAVFLDTFHVLQQPTYQSVYPPAQGGALALGQLLGHPWIGVLCSMAAMVMAFAWMLAGWFPPHWALLGGVLVFLRFALFNYWIDSYWGGAMAAVGGALVLGSFPRIVHHRRTRDALLLALGIGLLANTRPLEGFIFTVPVGVACVAWLIFKKGHSGIVGRHVLLPLLAGLVVTLGFVGYYNWRVTHNIFLLPRALYQEQRLNFPVFLWQSKKPPLHYSNPQFTEFYNVLTPKTYSLPWYRQFWEKCALWWSFFVGVPLSIPMLALPWLLKDRRIRLPLIQFLSCALGLLAVNYYFSHYAAPLTGTFYILLVQAMRHLRRWEFQNRPMGIFLTRFVVALTFLGAITIGVQAYRYPRKWWAIQRAKIVNRLGATPGKHLVLVRYTPSHNPHVEWVYNAADIDGAKIVWAREIPGRDSAPVLAYFKDRKVWVVQPDTSPPTLEAYPTQARP